MSNYSFFIGADISKAVIDVSYYGKGMSTYLGQYKNSTSGFTIMVKDLSRNTKLDIDKWFVCFENTGVYSKALLNWLVESSIACKEESALKISRSLGLRRGKNDKVDSKDICIYAFEKRDSIEASKLASPMIIKLKKLLSRRDFLVRQRQAMQVSLKEQKGFIEETTYEELNVGNEALLEVYNKQIKIIEQLIQDSIDSDKEVSYNDALARSVVGIGPITSAYMIAVTENYTVFDNPRKFACYCGVAPFPNQSGTRNGRTRISHIANKKMKSLFSNCTLSAIGYDKELKHYYERKIEEGKKKGVVMNAVKNKLIHRVFSVVKRKSPYVRLMKYA